MTKPKSIHFVGIKGVGMTPLAIIAHEAGITVTGSDIDAEFITDVPLARAGITPLKGFSPDHVGEVDLVITTGAHGGYENLEVKTAKERGITVLTKGEAVGAFMEGSVLGTTYSGISVAGSHGKTTTSAMIATILQELGKDPAYLIGTSEIPSLAGMPGHFGSGDYFVAEADEYANEPKHDKTPQFWHQHPQIILVTNVEHDHPDVYPTIEDTEKAFLHFVNQLPEQGLLILCGDGEQAKKLRTSYARQTCTYGFSPLNDYVITNYHIESGEARFTVENKGTNLGEFRLQVMGEHNALNALGACLVVQELGVPWEEARNAIQHFSGTKRRLEYIGSLETGALVYDDYAHHPTEIKSSLKALAQKFPEKEIICIFQPHTYSRTKSLFSEFTEAFSPADRLILLPIYASQREEADPSISSALLAEAIQKRQKNVLSLATFEDVVEYIDKNRFSEEYIILTMGAGDVYTLLSSLPYSEHNDDYSGTNNTT